MQSQIDTAEISRQHDGATLNATLRVVDVRKSFTAPNNERVDVLRGVSFNVTPGEIVAVMGASGSGKSTLLHLLGGLECADHGTVSLGTDDIARMNARELAIWRQTKIGFVFQFHYLLADLNALENVAMPLLISRVNRRAAFTTAGRLLAELGLEDRVDYLVSHLSGGEQQRVAVARAIVREPPVLLADEPTGNLDASVGETIGRTLARYTHEHNAVTVVATHSEQLARLCDRVLLLEGGKIYSS
jgi:lipoprotein-releasing system ATP-binding protein